MKTSRRTFIKQSALALAAASITQSAFSKKPNQLTGIQLYSVRDDMWNDPLGTLQKLSAMGYKYVEHAGYGERKFYSKWSAIEFKKVLGDLGISMPSGHTELKKSHWNEATNDFTDQWKNLVEDAVVVGQQFIFSPNIDRSWCSDIDVFKKTMDIFNKCGEYCKKQGAMYGYHNHHFEFSQKFGEKIIYDVILENTDPKLVAQQLDIGNLYNADATAIDIVRKWPGRFQSMHVKDEILSSGGHEKYESAILGKGIVNVKEVIDLGKKLGGTVHFIIEQESYQGKTPLDCVKEDLQIMKKWGY